MTDITQILEAMDGGDARAAGELLPLVYEELRRLAAHRMANESPDHTLEPTALVHEAYIRLVGKDDPGWQNRAHFFAAAAEAMRRILIDHARAKLSQKRGGERVRVELAENDLVSAMQVDDLLAMNEALDRLQDIDPPAAELVKLRFYGGLSLGEAAKMLGIGRRSADRLWSFARAWLYMQIRENDTMAGT